MVDEIIQYSNNNDYIYADVMNGYVTRYNNILRKYKESTGIPLELFKINEYEYSSTKKTVRDSLIDRFKINLNSSMELVNDMIDSEQMKNVNHHVPTNQMRKCLKLNVEGCPKKPNLDKNKVFVGMPFDNKYLDSYEYGIKLALESLGLRAYKANDQISNQDIMCKICEEMQICKYLIFNVSGLNPNVMLELGLSYGLGKNTIIVKDKETRMISDISNIEYIEYSHAGELNEKLRRYFSER